MKIVSFEDIRSWQLSQDLAVDLYRVFQGNPDFGFCNQIKRAVVSISNNIAEGFERSSDADFVRMLYISKGSAGEVRSMLYLAARLNFINEEQRRYFLEAANVIAKLITALIKSINGKGRGTGINLDQ